MSDIFFNQLNLPDVDYHLGVGSARPADQVGQMLSKIDQVLEKESPTMMVIIGDTNSTLAGALAAAKSNLPLVHVEAGLRSKNKNLPEQINRIVADRLSDILCCPDRASIDNLKKEGIINGVYLTGDILYDLIARIEPDRKFIEHLLNDLNLNEGKYILMTLHRAENVDAPMFLEAIISGIARIDREIVLPLHPRTEKNLRNFNLYDKLTGHSHLHIIKPVGILESLALTKSSLGVITDSGGIQREAAYFGKRAYILRDETEWLELESYGAVKCIKSSIAETEFDWHPANVPSDYFRNASGRIAESILGENN
jgi:UDP-N-acetylglucosamine 2-epimerase